MTSITVDELYTFHAIDREVFCKLMSMRNAGECLLIMATWMWLEQFVGFSNLISKMVNLPEKFVNALANEAMLCISFLKSTSDSNLVIQSNNGGLPFTAMIMNNTTISLHFFQLNKFTAITGIKYRLNQVCTRIFTDIILKVFPSLSLVPGFPDPVFGELTIVILRSNSQGFPICDPWSSGDCYSFASEEDRTLFLTFSRGFPVVVDEVKELFTNLFGHQCVESVHLKEECSSRSDEQPLFARLIMKSVRNVDQVLSGKKIAKFRIHGKHIWARKYERRDGK